MGEVARTRSTRGDRFTADRQNRDESSICWNRQEELFAARGRGLPTADYVRCDPVSRSAQSTIKAFTVNMLEGGHISEHDYLIGSKVATVMCGGDVEGGSLVDEQWFLDLERGHFMELIATEETQGRIEHMLKAGKPLRN